MKDFKPSRSTVIAGAVIAVLILIIALLGWKYLQTTRHNQIQNESQKTAARVQQAVGQIYLLPSKEEPTIAQIQDKTKLGNQEFFKDTQNGDYLLLYKETKLALVYRESIHKLVTVGPINLDNTSDGPSDGTSAGQPTKSNQ